ARGIDEGDLGGELVVLADEQDGKLPDRREVESFVEGSVVHGAVAEERDGHAVGALELRAITGPRGLKDARANDAAGAHQAALVGPGQLFLAAADQLHRAVEAKQGLGRGLRGERGGRGGGHWGLRSSTVRVL